MSGPGQKPALQATATAAHKHQVEQVTVSTIPTVKEVAQAGTKDLEVLVRVQAPTKATERVPIDLVAVLEMSDSMNWLPDSNDVAKDGKQSRLDLLKVAVKFVVSKLRGSDRLATVAFNGVVVKQFTTELKEIPDDRRKAELDFVDNITADSSNCLFGPALEKAVEILDNRTNKSRPGFIMFFSDRGESEVNAKATWAPEKYRSKIIWYKVSKDTTNKTTSEVHGMLRKYPVHTFGFGKFHWPKAMHAISTLSGGTYSFLNEDHDKITQAFGFCLGGLQTVVAADIKINLTVQPDNPEVRITDIHSGGYENYFPQDGRSGIITIPVLYAGEVKEFIVHIKVAPSGGTKQLLLTANGKCATWGLDGRVDAQIQFHDLNIERPQPVGKNQQQQQDGKVIEQVLRFKVLKMLSDFLQAMKSKGVNMEKDKETPVNSLVGLWNRVKTENPSIVQRYDVSVQAMLANLRKGDGGAFLCAWQSSNGMQRVTTMGSPGKVVDEYMTPAIQKMGEEAQKLLVEILAPPPPSEGCACLEFDMLIEQQIAYWSTVKLNRGQLRTVQQPVEVELGHNNPRSCYCCATRIHDVTAWYDGEERSVTPQLLVGASGVRRTATKGTPAITTVAVELPTDGIRPAVEITGQVPAEKKGRNACYTRGLGGHTHHISANSDALLCDYCQKAGHPRDECALLYMPKPVMTMYGVCSRGLMFFETKRSPFVNDAKQAGMVRVKNGTLSAAQVVAQLHRLVPVDFHWDVLDLGEGNFRVDFPNKAELTRLIVFGEFKDPHSPCLLQFAEWTNTEVVPYSLQDVWVSFHGVPSKAYDDFFALWDVGSLIGKTKALGMPFSPQLNVLRSLVGVINVDAIPRSTRWFYDEQGFELRIVVEDGAHWPNGPNDANDNNSDHVNGESNNKQTAARSSGAVAGSQLA
uniref:VWFA domain-containing protein n=1 Tax=Hordeum vulgare subsp. vulgare TaxID=112509 RepID=A0A8I6WUS4_HORVV